MIQSFPFDGQIERIEQVVAPGDQTVQLPILDRGYRSEDLQIFDSYLFTDGISQKVENCFKVFVSTGMNLSVAPGFAFVGGAKCVSDAAETIAIEASDPSKERIDAVVLRKDNSIPYRSVGIYVVKGTPADSPQAVAPVRTRERYEIVLAHVNVRAGTTSIAGYDVTDTRLNTALCGIMLPTPGVDTTGIFEQYQEAFYALEDWSDERKQEFLQMMTDSEADFNVWFDSVKGKLEGDVAAKLASDIEELKAGKADKSIMLTSTILTSQWIGSEPPYTADISLAEITGDHLELIEVFIQDSATLEQKESWSKSGIISGTNAAGKITLTAIYSIPEQDLPVTIIKHGDMREGV